jgi:hypothetical protein
LKLFRRLEEGVNPEFEIESFLTDTMAFPHAPPLTLWPWLWGGTIQRQELPRWSHGYRGILTAARRTNRLRPRPCGLPCSRIA